MNIIIFFYNFNALGVKFTDDSLKPKYDLMAFSRNHFPLVLQNETTGFGHFLLSFAVNQY